MKNINSVFDIEQCLELLTQNHLDIPKYLNFFLDEKYAQQSILCLNKLIEWECVSSEFFSIIYNENNFSESLQWLTEMIKILKHYRICEKKYAPLLLSHPGLISFLGKIKHATCLTHLEFPFLLDILYTHDDIDGLIKHFEYLLKDTPNFMKKLGVNIVKICHPQFEWKLFLEFFTKYQRKIDEAELIYLWFEMGSNYKTVVNELLGFLMLDCRLSLLEIEKLLLEISSYQWLIMRRNLSSLQGCVEPLVNHDIFNEGMLLQLLNWQTKQLLITHDSDAWFKLSVVLQVMVETHLLNATNLQLVMKKKSLSLDCCKNIEQAWIVGGIKGPRDAELFFQILNAENQEYISSVLASFKL